MRSHRDRRAQRGFALLTTGACLIGMVGMLGLATDIGRMYIVKSEAQAHADAAALTAALELDGTSAGITRAQSSLASSQNRWNMGTSAFSGSQIDFASEPGGPWETSPGSPGGFRFARVRATAAVPLYFLPAVTSARTSVITAKAVAAQLPKTGFREGVLPFSPFAHNSGQPDFGFTAGQRYTLRWPADPKLNVNVCSGDDAAAWVAQAQAGNNSERGYIEETSSDVIRAAIEQDYMTAQVTIGAPVTMTGGNKQTQRDSLITRINQDTDPTSTTYTQYRTANTGNGRRLVVVPVNSGYPDNIALGFGLFFLLDSSQYHHAGNTPFCAEYVGAYVQGSRHKGAAGAGAYVVRLVE